MAAKSIGLVFGEDGSDRKAIIKLAHGLRKDLPKIQERRKPPVLTRGLDRAKIRAKCKTVAEFVKVEQARGRRVIAVFVHEDCDAVEPAHVDRQARIEQSLREQGLAAVVPAAPAWEIEAWWLLWPQAFRSINSRWSEPKIREGQRVGLIENVKEFLKMQLRSASSRRDYQESDGVKVAQFVLDNELVDTLRGRSDSYDAFAASVRSLRL